MEQAAKKLRTEEEAQEGTPPKQSLSPFNFPDLTIKIGSEKLYVNKYHLMEVSPVFLKMLTGDFKEKDASEIKLPDENPTTLALFLRHTLTGFDSLKLTEKEAHLILPLTHKYLMDKLVSKIDQILAADMGEKKEKKYSHNYAIDELTDGILKAELYNLPNLLTACLENAYKLSYKVFVKSSKFHRISSDAKSKMLLMRCEELELVIGKCLDVLGRTSSYDRLADRKRICEARSILDSNK